MKNQVLTDNEKLALNVGSGEFLSIATVDDMLKQQATTKFNQNVNDYIEKLDKNEQLLNTYAEQFKETMKDLEIMPLYRYALIKPFDKNPFQTIKKVGNIITDTGGITTFENPDTGEDQEEDSYIQVAMVIEVGPECKYLKVGDVIMYRKESAFPIPFYKQNYHIVDEPRVSAVINEGLHNRLKNG